MLNDIEPALLVVEAPFDDLAGDVLAHDERAFDAPALSLGDGRWGTYADALPADGSAVERAERATGDPWLLLHTGGSTGTPKETVLTHGSVFWNAFNTITSWGVRPDDVTPLLFPMFHTGGWNVLTVPFFQMGATVLLRREVDPGAVLADVERAAATELVGTPTALGAMARHDAWRETDLSTLRFVKSGGGPCRPGIIDAWRDRGVEFSQGYGLTECGPNDFAMPTDAPAEKADSVGVPALCVDFRLVDDDGNSVDLGETGELELAGPAAADGYWGDPAADTDIFGAWVSTGDLARLDGDGYLHVEGRIDDMFVSDGENVYPRRVEQALTDHPDVEAAVVFGVPDERLGAVGRAVLESEADLALSDVEPFLASRVAEYAVPASLEVVESLPREGSSTVDRSAAERRFGPGD
jgi:fatty-acyl-CoA synthase